MLRRAIAVVAAVVVTATALVPSSLVCRCVWSGERMVVTPESACCPVEAPTGEAAPATLGASCCLTEEAPALAARVSPEREAGAGVPVATAALLGPAQVALVPDGAGSPSPALARGSPAGLRHKRLSTLLLI